VPTSAWDWADEGQFLAGLDRADLLAYRRTIERRGIDFDGQPASPAWRARVLGLIDAQLAARGPIPLVSAASSSGY
jgi:hypothetical protein